MLGASHDACQHTPTPRETAVNQLTHPCAWCLQIIKVCQVYIGYDKVRQEEKEKVSVEHWRLVGILQPPFLGVEGEERSGAETRAAKIVYDHHKDKITPKKMKAKVPKSLDPQSSDDEEGGASPSPKKKKRKVVKTEVTSKQAVDSFIKHLIELDEKVKFLVLFHFRPSPLTLALPAGAAGRR